MLVTEEAWNYASLLANTGEILQRYNNCIEKMQKIVKAIELKYN
jgi:glutaredoxin 2